MNMAMLAHHDSITGPLTAADLEDARRNNPGSIWHPHRHLMDPHGNQWPDTIPTQPAEACTEVGAEAAESMWRHRRTRATVGRVVLLAVACAAVLFAWPLVAA